MERGKPLHRAAVFGSPETVELARRVVADVDALENGVTAPWEAVMSRRPQNARALAAAGADPWRLSLGGWSPGRLSLAGPTPELFPVPEGVSLTDTERGAAQEARRLTTALGEFYYDGTGLACVAGIDATEAVSRLQATPVVDDDLLEVLNELPEDPYAYDMDESLHIVGVTSVPGGCVVTQPWGTRRACPACWPGCPSAPSVTASTPIPRAATRAASPAMERTIASDPHPGGEPDEDDTSAQVLASYLYQNNAVAYACAFAGLRPTDSRAVAGPPAACETIRVDGETVRLGAWLAKARTKHRAGQLGAGHKRLVPGRRPCHVSRGRCAW
ncbi:ankyrin repeat domain-containing protein [Streptomyces sp. NPDC001348]